MTDENTSLVKAADSNNDALMTTLSGNRQLGIEAIPKIAESKLETRLMSATREATAQRTAIEEERAALDKKFSEDVEEYRRRITEQYETLEGRESLPLPLCHKQEKYTCDVNVELRDTCVSVHIEQKASGARWKKNEVPTGDDVWIDRAELEVKIYIALPEWVNTYYAAAKALQKRYDAANEYLGKLAKAKTKIPELRRAAEAQIATSMLKRMEGGEQLLEDVGTQVDELWNRMELDAPSV